MWDPTAVKAGDSKAAGAAGGEAGGKEQARADKGGSREPEGPASREGAELKEDRKREDKDKKVRQWDRKRTRIPACLCVPRALCDQDWTAKGSTHNTAVICERTAMYNVARAALHRPVLVTAMHQHMSVLARLSNISANSFAGRACCLQKSSKSQKKDKEKEKGKEKDKGGSSKHRTHDKERDEREKVRGPCNIS